MKTDIFYQYQS